MADAPTPRPKKTPQEATDLRVRKLQKQIAAIEKKIDRNRKTIDPAFMLKELEYAGLHVDLWSAWRQLHHVQENHTAALKADEAAQGWATRKKAASVLLKNDMLPKILQRMEDQEKQASELGGLE
jgi:hypothetical protein